MALPGPRCLEVTQYTSIWASPGDPGHWRATKHSRNDKSPAILFASQESRRVALTHYHSFKNGFPSEGEKTSYIDPSRDILFCIPSRLSELNLHEYGNANPIPNLTGIAKAIPNLTRLAIQMKAIPEEYGSSKILKCFGKLRELLAVVDSMIIGRPTRPRQGCAFKDVDKQAGLQAWNEPGGESWDNEFFEMVCQWGEELQEEMDGGANEAWAAPRLRIGMFVECE